MGAFAAALAAFTYRSWGTLKNGSFASPQAPVLPSLMVAASIQAGSVAVVAGHIYVAAGLIGVSCFVVSWRTLSTARVCDAAARPVAARKYGSAIKVLLAIVATMAGLIPYTGSVWSKESGRESSTRNRGHSDPNLFSGIVLVSPVRAQTLIVPPVPALRRGLLQAGDSEPMSIPFSGEYWILHGPFPRPPEDSLRERGSPVDFNFTGAERRALHMQARQSLTYPIAFSCCSRIDVRFTSTEERPETVGIQLVLVNTVAPKPNVLRLPPVNLTEMQDGRMKFSLPKQPSIEAFDEIRVQFRLLPPRMHKSAHVAIERFYFVPAGQ